MKWMWAGRQAWRPVASSIRPTGPSVGTGYDTGFVVRNQYRPSAPVTNFPRMFIGGCSPGCCTS